MKITLAFKTKIEFNSFRRPQVAVTVKSRTRSPTSRIVEKLAND
jgi:hypothetical protein